MGERYMTRLVNWNIALVKDWMTVRRGRRVSSGRRVRARPKRTAKTTTWRISFSAMDLARFSGKTWRRNWSHLGIDDWGAEDSSGGCAPPVIGDAAGGIVLTVTRFSNVGSERPT